MADSASSAPQLPASEGSSSPSTVAVITGSSLHQQVWNLLARSMLACTSRLRRQHVSRMVAAAVVILGVDRILDFLQKSMLYYPRRYEDAKGSLTREKQAMEEGLARCNYKLVTVEYSFTMWPPYVRQPLGQQAFLVMPAQQCSIRALWIVYGGNAMLATDWFEFIIQVVQHFKEQENEAGSKHAFLLMDFPGYGTNEGSPSAESTLRSAEAGVEAAVRLLSATHMAPQELKYLGHSLGGAAVIQLAARLAERQPLWLGKTLPVSRLVLSATFTCIPDVARLLFRQLPGASSVLWAVGQISRHRWDSFRRLKELLKATQASPPNVAIVHGRRDEIVPVALGKELDSICTDAGLESCCFIEHPTASHNDVLNRALRTYFELICDEGTLSRQRSLTSSL